MHSTEKKQMETMTLEQKMMESWKDVRKRLFYPNLPSPELSDSSEVETACIDMLSHQIRVNRDFLEYFKERGVPYETSLTGLLAHEANHYLRHPFDLMRGLWLNVLASRVDKDIGKSAAAIYTDIVNNLDLIMRRGFNEVAELLKAQEADNPLKKIIKGYYQKATGMDMGIDIDNEPDDYIRRQVERLLSIDFFDDKEESRNITRFTRAVRDILRHYNMPLSESANKGTEKKDKTGKKGKTGEDKESGKNGEDENNGQAGKGTPLDGGLGKPFDEGAYDRNEIERALRGLAQKLKKDEFDNLLKRNPGLLISKGPGKDDGEIKEEKDITYYQKLAENYPVSLFGRPVESNGSLYPHTHKEFGIDDSPQDIDIFASLGKPFVPGLGKVWVKKGALHHSKRQSYPDAVIMEDISGSMNSCEPYAKAACMAAANAFLDRGNRVAVYLFNTIVDDTELSKGYQSDKESIHRGLAKSSNGGTVIDKKSLSKLDIILKEAEKQADVVLVTDLAIDGGEELLGYLHKRKDTHRVTVVFTGNENITELKEKYCSENFSVHSISSPEEIPGIIIGEISRGQRPG